MVTVGATDDKDIGSCVNGDFKGDRASFIPEMKTSHKDATAIPEREFETGFRSGTGFGRF
jgi:hypothetical protein